MKRLQRLLRQSEFQFFVFCLLLMLINWPFLAVSAGHGLIGIFSYLFAVWALVILLLFLIQRTLPDDRENDHEGTP